MPQHHVGRGAELVERYGRMVFATTFRILGNAEDAEDALQDTFLRFLCRIRDRHAGEHVRDWGAYLKTVATRCAIDMLRRRSRWRMEGLETVRLEPAVNEDLAQRMAQRQKADRLRAALRRIPPRDAQVFALRCFDELSYGTIAEHMGLSVSLVGVIMHRTRNRLRQLLECEPDPAAPGAEKGIRDVGASE